MSEQGIAGKPQVAVFPKGYIEALSEGRMSLHQWIEEAGTLGADGLEMYPRFFRQWDEAYLNLIKSEAQQQGLQIPMMCSSPDFTHPDAEFRKQQVDHMKHMIQVMAVLGPDDFRSCRVLSGQRRENVSREQGIRWTVESIRELLPAAERHRIHLVMENHYKDGYWTAPEFAQQSDIFLAIADQIESPWFGINYDPSNAVVAGEDPIALLERVKERVLTMHASDRYLMPGHSMSELQQHQSEGYASILVHGVIGRGLNDYPVIFEHLRSAGFQGWISVEDGVNGLEELRDSIAYVKQQIDQSGLGS
ncbi:sugar phosphate isomerase/epimerase family protein [Paenibacillus nasutitermitis]|uniref:Myo-inositol catabolism protein IolH n=1 Tax=Paenibacillus nasutitermitis TaxID=1652958 RepID=A0A916YWG5_9BACL|nr:sugar phosphate isomerase/epimerase family protein [Paenibacillus nasutitermitis]GGD64249.1 myo-inositol catabolism protein IolH [Paenibacillus nasutitermitis]